MADTGLTVARGTSMLATLLVVLGTSACVNTFGGPQEDMTDNRELFADEEDETGVN